ncbi:MAG: S8 family peptidase [Sciscionella sp.]
MHEHGFVGGIRLADLVENLAEPVLVHDADGPAECLFRPGELVVAQERADAARDRLRRQLDRTRSAAGYTTLVLRTAERHNSVRIAEDLGGELGIAPNHVHLASPVMMGAPIVFGTGARPVTIEGSVPAAPPEASYSPPVTAALFDTGLDPHPWFADRPWLSDWGLAVETLDGDGVAGQDRQAGHGTFVAGVLLQGAPGVRIRQQRALRSTGLTDDIRLAGALQRLRTTAGNRGERLDLIVLTCGCHTADDRVPEVLAHQLARFDDAMIIAAAGNGATERKFWPAALPDVIAVGATDAHSRRAEFSNHGPWVDVMAPGVDVLSSFVELSIVDDGLGEGSGSGSQTRRYGLASWSGTSFAAPAVAAAAARLLNDRVDVGAVRDRLRAQYPVRE